MIKVETYWEEKLYHKGNKVLLWEKGFFNCMEKFILHICKIIFHTMKEV